MKKIFNWASDNLLFICTLFLLVFIPLYPKIPLIDIQNTWVYIRAEDFFVFTVLFIWVIYLIRNKISLKTPLTIPILVFWLVGAVSTIHGIILIFPTIANVFPNVAFLSFLRHIEYLSVFFVAYAGMRDKIFLRVVIVFLVATLLGIIYYGFGQRYLDFPAFLTMNEEFAKGIPIQLSQLSRVPSTFAGHYDLAAYLVLIIPIIVSLMFGFKNWFLKIFLALTSLLGFVLLFMTVSRVSFFVLIIALFVVLFFQKRRLVLYSIPILAVFGFVFTILQPTTLLQRFGDTVNEVNVLVDANTGVAIGHVNYVSPDYFNDKIIGQQNISDKEELDNALALDFEDDKEATPSALLPRALFPEEVPLVLDANVSTGEQLIQGTGYINLSLSPVDRKLGSFFYEITKESDSTISAQVLIFHGDFLVKRAAAYDLSFTTRFQGGWPNAIESFERNVFLGSGYGTVSLAVDNNYLRILGEIGILGLASFIGIFLTLGIYIVRVLPKTESKLVKSFVIGFCAGVIGLALNATLIDVFAASKVAFTLWILTGVVVGLLSLYQNKEFNVYHELKKAASSPYAVVVYLIVFSFAIYLPILNNYFIGDDFTWFRWAADCTYGGLSQCPNVFDRITAYFTQADGFFYRPGTKVYFLLTYSIFWFNQVVFHAVSLILHITAVILFYLLARKILDKNFLAIIASILFVVMSGYAEMVIWISATGHLFNAVFILISLLLFILWDEKRKVYYLIASILFIFLATLFHELGVVSPLLIIAYKIFYSKEFRIKKIFSQYENYLIFIPVAVYLFMRFMSQSHWSGGDYSYSLINLPFNIIGNSFGYALLSVLGPISLPLYQSLRDNLKENLIVAISGGAILLGLAFYVYKLLSKKIDENAKRIVLFGISFFFISLLPFIGLGNITSRYSYLASMGIIIIIAFILGNMYDHLKKYGKDIAFGGTAVIILIFALLHIIQVQQLHKDWKTAGDKVERFFVSMDSLYRQSWSQPDTQLNFVNVPIKHNDAWVFPVGIQDALWLTFQNSNLQVNIYNNLEDAINAVGLAPNKPILVFEDNGGVREAVLFRNRITGELEYDFSIE